MLEPILDYTKFKEDFRRKFYNILSEFPEFRLFLYDIFVEGTAYVVGGFLRDLANNKDSRDLDIILSVSPLKIESSLAETKLNYTINRFGGVKVVFDNFQIDLWSLENNWSFKNNLIKRNEQNIVDNIASGSFYNFDSLVINTHSLELCVKYYNQCIEKNLLDINRKNTNYKKLNPTIEANIIRAFFLKEKFKLDFSAECGNYLIIRIKHLKDNHDSAINRLIEIKRQYKKYDGELDDDTLKKHIITLLKTDRSQNKIRF